MNAGVVVYVLAAIGAASIMLAVVVGLLAIFAVPGAGMRTWDGPEIARWCDWHKGFHSPEDGERFWRDGVKVVRRCDDCAREVEVTVERVIAEAA